jgi:hypothetical protein
MDRRFEKLEREIALIKQKIGLSPKEAEST